MVRPTARVVLLGPGDEVLLFCATASEDGIPVWFTPGGGVGEGEPFEKAAARELREETGIEATIGPWIWSREHIVTWKGRRMLLQERFFLARCDTTTVDITNLEDEEASVHLDVRWWTLDQMRASGERFAPRNLPRLLEPVLEGRLPAPPLDTGV